MNMKLRATKKQCLHSSMKLDDSYAPFWKKEYLLPRLYFYAFWPPLKPFWTTSQRNMESLGYILTYNQQSRAYPG